MNPSVTQEDVIYFIVTDRFHGSSKRSVDPSDTSIHGGTLDGIIEKLDYLIELGVTTLWVTPVVANIQSHNGSEPYHYYWPLDFGRMDTRLLDGNRLPTGAEMETFGAFVAECDSRGMKVVLDMIVNHTGYAAQGHYDANWFNADDNNEKDETKTWLHGLPDFDHQHPEVIDFFLNNIQDWIEKGKVNNIRMDTVKHVDPKFWHYFKTQLRGAHPEICLIGEVLLEGKEDVKRLSRYQNFHDFDSIFDFPLCTALRSTLIYDQSLREWLARPRLEEGEAAGVLDMDSSFTDGYRNANSLITLLDNHDLERRIMSHARSKHEGDGIGLDWAIRVTKLCLGALFTMRGIPQLYYGTELGLEGWKAEDDRDLRRDFPWHLIDENHHPKQDCRKEREIYTWTQDLIRLRKGNSALKYGTTITLWSDDLVYAFLRIATDDVALVIINNGYQKMPTPIQLKLNPEMIPQRAIDMITGGLRHWKTRQGLDVQHRMVAATVEGKTIDIYCRNAA